MSDKIMNFIEKAVFSLILGMGLVLFLTPPTIGEFPFFSKYAMFGKAGVFVCLVLCFLCQFVKEKRFDGYIGLFSLFSFSVVLGFLSQRGSLSLTVWNNVVVPMSVIMLLYLSLKADVDLSVKVIYTLYMIFAFINIYSVYIRSGAERLADIEGYFLDHRNTHIYFYLIPLFTGYYGLKKGILRNRILYIVLYACVLSCGILTRGLTALIISILWGIFLILNCFLDISALFGFCFTFLVQSTVFALFQIYNGENNSLISKFLEFAGKNENVSSRSPLWKLTRAEIMKAPIFGYGAREMEPLLKYPHPHNIYLHMAYNRGILGILLFLCIVFLLYRVMNTVKDRKIRGLMGFFIFVILLSGQFDEYNTVFYAFYGGIVYYLSVFGEKCNE